MPFSLSNYGELADLTRRLPFLGDIQPDGRKVFVRADLNVPTDEHGQLADDGRLRAVLPTLNHLLDCGAAVVVGSHFRDPQKNGSSDKIFSLAPMARRLSRIWEAEVKFSPEVVGPIAAKMAAELKPGEVLLLENLRFHPGEKAADPEFARQLAELTDRIYVNDAFGVCHRNHASVTTMLSYMDTCVAGYALKNELNALKLALSEPARPMAAIIGGNDIETKMPVLANFMRLADYVLLGGLLGDAFSRLVFTQEQPKISENALAEMKKLTVKSSENKATLFIPVDAVVADSGGQTITVTPAQLLKTEANAVDIGPATRMLYREVLSACRTIIWSGPMGLYEKPAFSRGTAFVAQAMAECQGVTLAGGVDTSAAILKMSDRSKVSFISTGGSAFLQALAGQPLAGLEVLLKKAEGR